MLLGTEFRLAGKEGLHRRRRAADERRRRTRVRGELVVGNRRVVLRFESAEGAEKDLRRTERVGAERSYLGHRLTQMDTDKELRQEILTADAEPRKNK